MAYGFNGNSPPGTGGPMMPPGGMPMHHWGNPNPIQIKPDPGFNGRSTQIPRFYQPPKGAPREYPAFLTPMEMQMLARMTDNTVNMTRHGIPSFRLDDQDTKDMNSTTSTNYNSGGTGPRGPTGPGGEPRTNYSGTGGNPNISVGTGGTGPRGPTGPNGEPRTNYSGSGGNPNVNTGGGGNSTTGARGPTGPNGESKTNYTGTGGNPNINVSTSGNAAAPGTAATVSGAVQKVTGDLAKLAGAGGQVGPDNTPAPKQFPTDRIMAPAPLTGYESMPLNEFKKAFPANSTFANTWSELNTPTTPNPVYDPNGAVPQQIQQQNLAQDAWRGSTIQNQQAVNAAYDAINGVARPNMSIDSNGYIGTERVGSLGDYGQVPKQYTDRVPNQQKDQSRIAATDTNYNASLGRYGGPFESAYSGNPNPVGAWNDNYQPANDVVASNNVPTPKINGGTSVSPSQYSGPAQNLGELGNKFTNAYDRAKYGKENMWGRLGDAFSRGDFRGNTGQIGSGGEANSGYFKYGDMGKGNGRSNQTPSPGGNNTYTPPVQPSFTDWYAKNPWKYPEYTQTWAFTPFGQYWPY